MVRCSSSQSSGIRRRSTGVARRRGCLPCSRCSCWSLAVSAAAGLRFGTVCQNRHMRRIAEIVGTLAMATDLGLGLPIEHAIRACLMSIEMGRRVGMAPAELSELYYLMLLRMLGCTSGSSDNAYFFGHEVASTPHNHARGHLRLSA